MKKYNLLTYKEAFDLTQLSNSPFYESKLVIDNFSVSIFNYRLAQYSDFIDNKAFEMRGLTFVFNEDGSLFKRYLLLHKFFNLNQVPESQYSLFSEYVIKSIYNKEDGSVASFIRLPNGKIVCKSKMSFESVQALGMNRLYNSISDLKRFVDWSLDNDLVAVFEYVAPTNRIVLKYSDEELILLRLRDNETGEYLDLSKYSDKIGSIKVAPSDVGTLDELVELSHSVEDKEGWIIEFNNGLFIKIKTPWYCERHGLLTEDLYREHIIIGYILDDKIDDILGQIPEDEKEAHIRINKIIEIVKKSISDKVSEIEKAYEQFVKSGISKKDYAINQRKGNPNFGFVMNMVKADDLKKMSKEEILNIYDNMGEYEKALQRCEPYEMVKMWLRDLTKRLNLSREWLQTKDKTLFFQDPEESDDDN